MIDSDIKFSCCLHFLSHANAFWALPFWFIVPLWLPTEFTGIAPGFQRHPFLPSPQQHLAGSGGSCFWIWGVPWSWGYPKMDCVYGKTHLYMDDLGVPLFWETSIWMYRYFRNRTNIARKSPEKIFEDAVPMLSHWNARANIFPRQPWHSHARPQKNQGMIIGNSQRGSGCAEMSQPHFRGGVAWCPSLRIWWMSPNHPRVDSLRGSYHPSSRPATVHLKPIAPRLRAATNRSNLFYAVRSWAEGVPEPGQGRSPSCGVSMALEEPSI